MRPLWRPTLVALLSSAALAQTYVVDAHNGPGAHFTSIAAAVAAVPDGAVLLVRPATYGGFVIQRKSLTVLGEPGAHVDFLIPALAISGLGPAQSVVLRGLSWSNALGPAFLSCESCSGRVLIEACRSDRSVATSGGGILARRCDQLHVRDSVFHALTGGALVADGCNTEVLGCDLRSTGFWTEAIAEVGGTLQISSSSVGGALAARAAVTMSGGTLVARDHCTLAGDASGTGLVVDGSGLVRLDPNTVLVPPGAGVGRGIALSSPSMPSVAASTQPLGGLATASFAGPTGAGVSGALVVGFPGPPRPALPFADAIWIDPQSALVVAVGGVRLTATYNVPAAPWARGVVIGWQGFSLDAVTGAAQASNPAVYVHR